MSTKINLFTMCYEDKNPERKEELNLCFFKNLNNPKLNTILLKTDFRLKYSDFIRIINNISKSEDINIICNSDIYFENDIDLYLSKLEKDQCYALSRWDLQKDGSIVHFCRPDSQDSWIFRGIIKNNLFSDFHIGYRGCDNRFAYELNKCGYQVLNPSKTIKSIHVHTSNVRNYSLNSNDQLVEGPYLTVYPVEL